MILFTDVTCGDGAAALRGAVSVAGAGVAWSGGATAAGCGGARAAHCANGSVLRDHVVAITLDCQSRVIDVGHRPDGR